MVSQIKLGDVTVDVLLKDIKNVHLSVHPPTGRVRISAPSRMKMDTIRVFAISKLAWIRQQQKKLRDQDRETPREYVDRESHYLWGRRVLLKVVEADATSSVRLQHRQLLLQVRPDSDEEAREAVASAWYRDLLKTAVPPLVEEWEPRLKVSVAGFFVRQMKTKWGSCNPASRTIRLNTELVKKPKDLLEYVVVHVMVHLIAPTHSEQFVAFISRHYPSWREARAELNELPLGAEVWKE